MSIQQEIEKALKDIQTKIKKGNPISEEDLQLKLIASLIADEAKNE